MASSLNASSYSIAVETSWIMLLAIIPIIIIMTLAASGAYIITLVKKRTVHTPSNTLLGALALSDVSVGIVANPTWVFRISTNADRNEKSITEKFSIITMFFFILLSFLKIVMVNVDRYIAIFYPYWRRATSTCKTHLKVVVAVLAISIMMSVPIGMLSLIHRALQLPTYT